MPQLDVFSYPTQIFWLIVIVSLIYSLLASFFFPDILLISKLRKIFINTFLKSDVLVSINKNILKHIGSKTTPLSLLSKGNNPSITRKVLNPSLLAVVFLAKLRKRTFPKLTKKLSSRGLRKPKFKALTYKLLKVRFTLKRFSQLRTKRIPTRLLAMKAALRVFKRKYRKRLPRLIRRRRRVKRTHFKRYYKSRRKHKRLKRILFKLYRKSVKIKRSKKCRIPFIVVSKPVTKVQKIKIMKFPRNLEVSNTFNAPAVAKIFPFAILVTPNDDSVLFLSFLIVFSLMYYYGSDSLSKLFSSHSEEIVSNAITQTLKQESSLSLLRGAYLPFRQYFKTNLFLLFDTFKNSYKFNSNFSLTKTNPLISKAAIATFSFKKKPRRKIKRRRRKCAYIRRGLKVFYNTKWRTRFGL